MTALCSIAAFVSAFLLFSVQPMVAKMLLPSLGGSPSVWNTAMVFYQGALLLGYGYAHLVALRLPLPKQRIVHGTMLLLPIGVLPLSYFGLHPPTEGNPTWWMLFVMATSVGLPFMVLSASSPLIQSWFAKSGGGDPYFLYAASNVGSFAGLLAYPLLIEPRVPLAAQSNQWAVGYVVLVVLFAALMSRLKPKDGGKAHDEEEDSEGINWNRRLKWVFLAFVPSSQFIGVTAYLTTDIAVMPLLWVIPLSIYLLTMVMVFARKPLIPHKWVVGVFPFALAGLTFMIVARVASFLMISFAAHLAMLFIGALMCHGELAKDRPASSRLTEFFLLISVGGVLGGIFNALIAPALFVSVLEYAIVLTVAGLALPFKAKSRSTSATMWDFAVPIALVAAVMFVYWLDQTGRATISYPYRVSAVGLACIGVAFSGRRPVRFALGIGALMAFGLFFVTARRDTLFAGRSFFGVYRVDRYGESHQLTHGRILHGEQIMLPDEEAVPSSYYHIFGPLKELVGEYSRPADSRVAAIGLGTGNISLWSKPGERWTFFEIDPLVERIARDPKLFTCLAKAKGQVDVVIGDARLKLAESTNRYDLIAMDAFSSDAIPVHLLTLEAFQMYATKLTPRGIMAVHISNKFMTLEPLVAAICEKLGWAAYICDEAREKIYGPMPESRTPSTWMAVGPSDRDWGVFQKSARWRLARTKASVSAWTDDYSSLVQVLRPGAFKLR